MGDAVAIRRMILCGGLQSGGTTLVSWCFLQRRDTNGVLDMPNGRMQTTFEAVAEPVVWVKMTVGGFRWVELRDVYRDLGWDEAMIAWPKTLAQIPYVSQGNPTFWASVEKGSLAQAKLRDRAAVRIEGLPLGELEWLEETFAAYNDAHGYPAHITPPADAPVHLGPPCFEGTTREWWIGEYERLHAENAALQRELEALRREVKATAFAGGCS